MQDAERLVADLKAQLADPALYDGSGATARRAGELGQQLADAERALDDAMERWAEVERR